MSELKTQIRVLESCRASREPHPSAAGDDSRQAQGLAEPSFRLNALAITADARSTAEVELLSIWRELAGGLCNVVTGFFTAERCYLVLSPITNGPANPVEARQLEILEAVLGGLRQKCMAIDLGLAPSTIALQFKLALASIGVGGRPSRAHPLLMLIARAASVPVSARYATFLGPDERNLRVISAPHPDQSLRAMLPVAEFEVVKSLIEGLTYHEIATQLCKSSRTVANQVSAVFRRLEVSGRNELVQRLLFEDTALKPRPVPPRRSEPCPKQGTPAAERQRHAAPLELAANP